MARRSSHSTASRLHVWLVLIECRLDWNEWIFETFHGGFPLRSHPLPLRGFAFSVYIIGGKIIPCYGTYLSSNSMTVLQRPSNNVYPLRHAASLSKIHILQV